MQAGVLDKLMPMLWSQEGLELTACLMLLHVLVVKLPLEQAELRLTAMLGAGFIIRIFTILQQVCCTWVYVCPRQPLHLHSPPAGVLDPVLRPPHPPHLGGSPAALLHPASRLVQASAPSQPSSSLAESAMPLPGVLSSAWAALY